MESLKTGARALGTNLVWIQCQNPTEKTTVCFNAIRERSTLRVTQGSDIHVMGWDACREGRKGLHRGQDTAQTMIVHAGLHRGASCTIRYGKGPGATSTVSPSVRLEIGHRPSMLWSQGLCFVTKILSKIWCWRTYLTNNSKDMLPTWTPRGHR